MLLECCINGDLCQGDYVIVDNAALHHATYSPELNPCEKVFAMVKSHIRHHRDGHSSILFEILKSLSTITVHHVLKFYENAIFPTQILPDLIQ